MKAVLVIYSTDLSQSSRGVVVSSLGLLFESRTATRRMILVILSEPLVFLSSSQREREREPEEKTRVRVREERGERELPPDQPQIELLLVRVESERRRNR